PNTSDTSQVSTPPSTIALIKDMTAPPSPRVFARIHAEVDTAATVVHGTPARVRPRGACLPGTRLRPACPRGRRSVRERTRATRRTTGFRLSKGAIRPHGTVRG